jgi:hypothetical protein
MDRVRYLRFTVAAAVAVALAAAVCMSLMRSSGQGWRDHHPATASAMRAT